MAHRASVQPQMPLLHRSGAVCEAFLRENSPSEPKGHDRLCGAGPCRCVPLVMMSLPRWGTR